MDWSARDGVGRVGRRLQARLQGCWRVLFNSYIFIFAFLPITLAGFVLLAGRRSGGRSMKLAMAWLVIASLVYYGYWNPIYLLLIFFSIGLNYSLGLGLANDRRTEAGRRRLLILGCSINLLLLGYFKYVNFAVDTVNDLFGTDVSFPRVILPIGISFFTFQQIAYLVDSYRNQTREYRFVDYCLFVTFFPQLIAGPIVHHQEMLPQFERNRSRILTSKNLVIGLSIFTIGLFKKVIIADSLTEYATPVFDHAATGAALSPTDAWLGAVAYTLQLYFDFSGYSDMAVGLARLFGIRLPINFHSPYKAANIAVFWRRWHMTLSRFLRDYLYIPLGGNRKGEKRRLVNLMLTMLLGGLWHGAGWTFVAWGGLHGLFLVIHQIWQKRPKAWRLPFGGPWLAWMLSLGITQLAVMVAWVFFRAEDFGAAWGMLQAMAGLTTGDEIVLAGPLRVAALVVGLYLFCLWAPNTTEIFARFKPVVDIHEHKIRRPRSRILQFRPNFWWLLLLTAMFGAAVIGLSRASEFLYFQF